MAGAFSSAFSSAFDVGAGNQTATPGVATVAVAGVAPSASGSGTATSTPAAATVAVSAAGPAATAMGTVTVTPGAASVAVSAIDAAASGSGTAASTPGTATVTVSAADPAGSGSGTVTATPAVATVTVAAIAPAASGSGTAPVTPGVATVTVTAADAGASTSAAGDQTATPGVAVVTVAALAVDAALLEDEEGPIVIGADTATCSFPRIPMDLDYRVWDNTQPGGVYLELPRRGRLPHETDPRQAQLPSLSAAAARPVPAPAQSHFVCVAKRRAIRWQERAASGGVYTSADVVWLLPQVLLPQGVQPRIGGVVVVPAENQRWTILEVQHNKDRQTWRLVSRDLVLHFDLRDLVDVERPQVVYDPAGAPTLRFPPHGGAVLLRDLPCRVQPESREQVEEHGRRVWHETFRVYLGRDVDLSSEDRIRWPGPHGDRYLDVIRYEQTEVITELSTLHCVAKS